MPVRPVLRAFLALNEVLDRPPKDQSVAARRRASLRGPLQMRVVTRRGRVPVATEDHRVPVADGEILVRSYRPATVGPDVLPVHLYLHGGSFWLGGVEQYDPICRFYAGAVGCVVVSVDYRLAPEHPYPTGLEDAYAALVWVAQQAPRLGVDPDRLSVGGFSAGGGLAASLALLSRDRSGPPIRFQLLESPVLDLTLSQPSTVQFATGFGLSRADLTEGYGFYLRDPGQTSEAYVSPLLAADLSGLPPAFVRTCEYDPLRDEGEAYVDRLRAAGVPAELDRVAGHLHSSVFLSRLLPSAREALARAVAALRRAQRPD